jgi:hypothetical protein
VPLLRNGESENVGARRCQIHIVPADPEATSALTAVLITFWRPTFGWV